MRLLDLSLQDTFHHYRRRPSRFIFAVLSLLTFIYIFDVSYYGNEAPFTSIVHNSQDLQPSQLHNTVSSIRPLPTKITETLRKVQHFQGRLPVYDISLNEHRRRSVKKVFEKGWKSYRRQAWLQDELRPIKGGGKMTTGGWVTTLIDSLDTLWIMGMKKDFREAVRVIKEIDWTATTEQSCDMFNAATRQLGGLLSAYDLTKEPALLSKAVELGEILYAGFDTQNRMPVEELNFSKAKAGQLTLDEHQSPSKAMSLALEFTRLSQLSGNDKFYDAISRVADVMFNSQNTTKLPGLWPTSVDLQNNIFNHNNVFTMGSSSGTMYQSILNMHILLHGAEAVYEHMFLEAIETIMRVLFFKPMTHKKTVNVLFTGTFQVGDEPPLKPILQQQACFVGGMFALGGRIFNNLHYVDLGANLTNSCIWAYSAFPNSIMPEVSQMVQCPNLDRCKWEEQKWIDAIMTDYDGREDLPKGFQSARDPSYSLRHEAIESIFILYRITGHEEYREHAWKIFEAVIAATESKHGNAAIEDVTVAGKLVQQDSMESRWMSSTLKYFYLLFSPHDLISLDEFVLNPAGHPVRIPPAPKKL